MQGELRYPGAARRRGLQGVVHVRFTVTADGATRALAVVKGSRYGLLNDAAVDTVTSVGRLPAPPKELGDRLAVRVPIVFRMRR